ncbi:hypothetical protein LSH36_154g01063 [Paralvinella palmiformis]|uniref:Cytochrome c oxidase assembly factor 6 n=1 Tax=Paralvinella palmiformis TaxID=53620 RepID=A0AAD9JU51_9ANNE|nr:hypothetical protein LSH36_154g01063 [Paralvinella palmiformis]
MFLSIQTQKFHNELHTDNPVTAIAMAAPTKDEREKCWNARDSLWKCLDENNDDESKCTKFRKAFQKHCSKQWTKYFDRRRAYLKYEAKLKTDGYDPVDEPRQT